jgi:type II secretory pathway component GspD/PulD (secretin)
MKNASSRIVSLIATVLLFPAALPVSAQNLQFSEPANTPAFTGGAAVPVPAVPVLAAPAPAVPAPAVPQSAVPVQKTETKNYVLKNASAEVFERRFFEKLGSRFVPVQTVENLQDTVKFQLPGKNGTKAELSLNRKTGNVSVSGTEDITSGTLKIVQLLDAPLDAAGTSTEFVEVQKNSKAASSQAAQLVGQLSQKASPATAAGKVAQNQPVQNQPLQNQPQQNQAIQNQQPQFRPLNQTQINPAIPNTAVPNTAVPNPQNGANNAVGLAENNAGIVGPVQIDIIDGLDTMVIKGDPRDVAAVKNMLKQIEAMSLEYEPVIELTDMKHADSYRVSQIVQQLYSQVYAARKGNITMLPLLKPNTILIIGKKESIDTAKELITKLDTEVKPDSEFIIIRLKNASSDALLTQVQQFYANRTGAGQGLETQLTVVSDYRTNSLIVQASPRDLTEIAALVKQLDAPGSEAVNSVKTFPLKNAMASELATTLQNAITGSTTTGGGFGVGASSTQTTRSRSPMITMNTLDKDGNLQKVSVLYDVRIVADTRSNTLIVTAPTESMPLIEALIKQLDQLPSAESQIKVFTLVNGDASNLTTVLTNLFATSSTAGGGFGGGGAQTSQIATVRPGIEEGESTLVSVRFQADTRTNSIIACGTAGDMAVVEAILLRLDEENMNNRKVMVLKPLNARASDIATAIQNYVSSERQLEIQNSSTFYPQSPAQQYRKEVIAVAEDVTNSLIISTTPRYYEQIKKLVAELDERPLMVAIQVLIAEVTLRDNREHGVEVGLQDSLLFDRSLMSGTPAAMVPGFLFGNPSTGLPLGNVNTGTVGTQGITSLGVNRPAGGGFIFSASSESVSVLIRALEEQSRMRVLSRPQLTVMHENIGSISVGQKVPYVTGTSTGTNGNMQTSTEFYEVGTILDLLPRIMPDGVVALGIHAERSSVSETDGIVIAVSDGQPITSPRVNQAIAETVIHARDGQTIVFAGLISEEKTTTEKSVPFLNKIPVVKHFFEYKTTKCSRSELLIILTPTIIRNEADVEILRQQEASRMHWCINDVVKLTGNSGMRMRYDEWSPSEIPVIHGEAVILDEKQLPSEDKIRMMYPAPKLAPKGDEK